MILSYREYDGIILSPISQTAENQPVQFQLKAGGLKK